MALSCEPGDLLAAAECAIGCLSPRQRQAVRTYALAVVAGGSVDPGTLVNAAVEFFAVSDKQAQMIQNQLLSVITPVLETNIRVTDDGTTRVDDSGNTRIVMP